MATPAPSVHVGQQRERVAGPEVLGEHPGWPPLRNCFGRARAWLEDQGKDRWWNVDGDPLLTGRLTFPCPASDLAAELRKIDRPLLVQAKKDDKDAKGQPVGEAKLDELVVHFSENLHDPRGGEMPPWGGDRLFYLRWKGAPDEWLLEEDSETTEQMLSEERGQGSDAASVKRE